jgi:hypothetical protein
MSISLLLPTNRRKRSNMPGVWVLALLLIFADCAVTAAAQEESGLRWWKGNLHAHTLWSDGRDYPEMVVDWYKKHGYHFLALSEHNLLARGRKWIDAGDNRAGQAALQKYTERFGADWVQQRQMEGRPQVRLKPLSEFRCLFEEPDRFLLIPTEEITDKKAHLNAVNLREVVLPQGGDTTSEVLQNNISAVFAQRQQTQQAMLAFINHPNFRWDLTAEDMMRVQSGDAPQFFEVYNWHPGVRNYGDEHHVGTERMWDIVLTKRLAELDLPIMYGLATDDAHNYHKWGPKSANPGRGWVMVRARRLTPESVVKALERGDFYASTGVALRDIRFDGKTIEIAIESEKGVSYTTQFIGTLKGYEPTGRPVIDQDGAEIRTTHIYSDQIGTVLAKVRGSTARYMLNGREIYVRAKVISTKPKDNPFLAGDVEVAWVQPVVPTSK